VVDLGSVAALPLDRVVLVALAVQVALVVGDARAVASGRSTLAPAAWALRAAASGLIATTAAGSGAPWVVLALSIAATAVAGALWTAARSWRSRHPVGPHGSMSSTAAQQVVDSAAGIWAEDAALVGVVCWVAVPAVLVGWFTGEVAVLVGLACVVHAAATVPVLLAGWSGTAPVRSEAGQLLTALLTLLVVGSAQLTVWLYPAYTAAAAALTLAAVIAGGLRRTRAARRVPAQPAAPTSTAPVETQRWRRALAPAATLIAWVVLGGWLLASTPPPAALPATALEPAVRPASAPVAVAVSPDDARIAEAHFDRDEVSIVDRATGLVTASIRVGDGPQYVAWTPDGRRVLTVDVLSDEVSIVDVDRGALATSLPVPSPVGIVVDSTGTAYVRSSDPAGTTRIDPDVVAAVAPR
jgi:hypothetical protein